MHIVVSVAVEGDLDEVLYHCGPGTWGVASEDLCTHPRGHLRVCGSREGESE